jgi:hypothetical protein
MPIVVGEFRREKSGESSRVFNSRTEFEVEFEGSPATTEFMAETDLVEDGLRDWAPVNGDLVALKADIIDKLPDEALSNGFNSSARDLFFELI